LRECEDEIHTLEMGTWVSQPHFGLSVRMKFTLPKVGTWSLPGLPKIQSLIAWVKKPCIGVFLISLERSWSLDAQNGLPWVIWTSAAQVMGKKRESTRSRRALRECNMVLESSQRELQDWFRARLGRRSGREVVMAQSPGSPNRDNFGILSGLHFGSPETKSHLGVGAVEQHREYYMGEGGGFPRAQAVVSQVSPRLPVACPNTKRVHNEF
jgi:hypothetical protein